MNGNKNMDLVLLRISCLLAVAVVVGQATPLLSRADLSGQFAAFRREFKKIYADEAEEATRLGLFVDNVNRIAAHNREADLGVHHFRLGINQFADMTTEEFRRQMNGLKATNKNTGRTASAAATAAAAVHKVSGDPLPEAVDWREYGLVTPVKNQGNCGSCWAFSAVASLEGQHAKAAKKLVSLSEQNIVDCSDDEGNWGCLGGLMDLAFQYVMDAGGVDTEAAYPYVGWSDGCNFSNKTIGATMRSYVDIPTEDEAALQDAIARVGPIAVGIDAGTFFFQFYRSGVLLDPLCSSHQLDHGVTAVGYGVDGYAGQKYYLVKNSWGTTWGMGGYVLMPREAGNKCGIASNASYPIV